MNKEEKNIRNLYRELINNFDFEKLELELKTPNIFKILNISRNEIRHSNFLGWLLDPNGNHGLGKLFLLKFIREIASSEIANEIDELEISNLNFDNVEIRREWKNIDLLIIFESTVVCIENKVDSKDHSNQLLKYNEIIKEHFTEKKKIFTYLTPHGEEPKSKFGKENYTLYSYQQIIEHLDKIIEIHGHSINPSVFQYIKDYSTNLKRELMKTDKLNDLASKIYKNHKELIDFIIENKPDLASDLYPVFENWFKQKGMIIGSKNKGCLKFSTPKLEGLIPKKGQGWPQKESFLFEIDFFWNKKNKAVFKSIVAPCDKEVQDILRKAIENVEGFKKPYGEKWLVHFQFDWKFIKENHEDEININEIYKSLEIEWEKMSRIIFKIEKEILKQKEKLISLQ
jgi:PD-(D/E)XK nuclease superfamily